MPRVGGEERRRGCGGGRRRDRNCRAEALRLKGTCARGPKTAFSNEIRCTSDTAQLAMASTTFPVLPIQKFAGRNAPVRRPTVSAYPISDAPDRRRPEETPCARADRGEGNHTFLIRRRA